MRRGHRTLFDGVLFRSRHEAKWAAFFNSLNWKWDYEPLELDGYLPDFDILFGKKPLLVEIKPLQESMPDAKEKILLSGWTGDIAILVNAEGRFVGEFFEEEIGWSRCVLTFCLECKRATLAAEDGRWQCRNCLAGNRSLWWAYSARDEWHAAQNLTQWRPAAE